MAFRDKTASLTPICMVLAYRVHSGWVAAALSEPHPATLILWLGGVTTVQLIAIVIGSLALAASAGREASGPADDRDKAIARRATQIAYYALLVGTIMVAVVMPFDQSGSRIIRAALLALVVAETIWQGTVVLGYRRGWHG